MISSKRGRRNRGRASRGGGGAVVECTRQIGAPSATGDPKAAAPLGAANGAPGQGPKEPVGSTRRGAAQGRAPGLGAKGSSRADA